MRPGRQEDAGLIITESAAVHATSNAYNIQLTNRQP